MSKPIKILRCKDAKENHYTKKGLLFDLPMRILCVGKSQFSGKSSFLLNILCQDDDRLYKKNFEGDNIYIFSGSLSSDNKIKNILNKESILNNLKNEINNLSKKCNIDNILNTRIFLTNKEKEYLNDRLKIEDNALKFHFQGKDFNIECKDRDNTLNIVMNEFSSNLYFNKNNIFNFMTPKIIENSKSNYYTIEIRNNILKMFKNKMQLILQCKLPEIFNIESVGLRSYNKCWWIVNI